MDIIPNDNLNPEAKPWARSITAAVKDYLSNKNSIANKTNNTVLNQNATINKLQQQVAALTKQQAFTASFITKTASAGGVTVSTITTADGPTATVTMTITRTTTFLFSASSNWLGNANSATTVMSSVGRLFTNVDGGGALTQNVASVGGNGNGFVSASASLYASNVYTLDPGVHTFAAYGEAQVQGTSGLSQVGSVTVVVSVIG